MKTAYITMIKSHLIINELKLFLKILFKKKRTRLSVSLIELGKELRILPTEGKSPLPSHELALNQRKIALFPGFT